MVYSSEDEDDTVHVFTNMKGLRIKGSPSSTEGLSSASTTTLNANSKMPAPRRPPPRAQQQQQQQQQPAEVSTNECPDLPERYLDRCAVLLDVSMLMDPDFKDAGHERTHRMVEGYYRVVQYPLCHGFRTSNSRSILQEPFVDVTNLQKNHRKNLLFAIQKRVENRHGISPHLQGAPVDAEIHAISTNCFHQFQRVAVQTARSASTRPLENANRCGLMSVKSRADVPSGDAALREFFTTLSREATQWCRVDPAFKKDGDDEGIAFVTTHDREEEVRRALAYAQVDVGVKLPRHRIYCLEDVVGPSWAQLLTRDSRVEERCVYHEAAFLNKHSYQVHCSKSQVAVMDDLLATAAKELEAVTAASSNMAAVSSPFEEDEDEN